MSFLNSINISASGLTAQRLRMDTIANNIANVDTVRGIDGNGPYRRQVVIFEARNNQVKTNQFHKMLDQEKMRNNLGNGVTVREIRELNPEEAPFRRVYEPSHPEADNDGFVNYPNVNIVEEMINMISSTRAYEANTKAIEASRNMAMRALEIGR